MRAIVLTRPGGPEVLAVQELPMPVADAGHVVIKVRGFGLNRAETYMRRGLWPTAARVLGIECVGEVHEDGSGRLARGRRVAAIMGGMGRTIDGSYAEYVRAPATNVVPLDGALGWAALAAIPESYATAWMCLHRILGIAAGQTLLVRGGTSALGQAAIQLGRLAGARVLATSRDPGKLARLEAIGAMPLLDGDSLVADVRRGAPDGLDAALELVGNSKVVETISLVHRGGGVCLAGFLGGIAPIAAFDPIVHLPSGVSLHFFASFVLGRIDFPLSEIPLQDIVARVAAGEIAAAPARVLGFDEVAEGHRLMEASQANGKLVVEVPTSSAS
jgi:NADPH:quinone reductase-like Zn-dependent oxidoreductase